MSTATPAAMGSDRSIAHAAAAMAVTVRVTNSFELNAPYTGANSTPARRSHEARDDPGQRDHSVGVDPVQLHQTPALHGTPHLQTQAREAQKDGEENEDDDGDRDRGEVDPVDRGPVGTAADGEVHGVRVEEGEDRRGGIEVLGAEDDRQQEGMPTRRARPQTSFAVLLEFGI